MAKHTSNRTIDENLIRLIMEFKPSSKARTIRDLLQRGVAVPERYLKSVVNFYIKEKDFSTAEFIAERGGLDRKTVVFIKKQCIASRYSDDSDFSTDDYLDGMEKAEMHLELAELAKTEGKTQLAIKEYKLAGLENDAACIAERAGLTTEAIRCYVDAEMFKDAARISKKEGLTEESKAYQTLDRLLTSW